MITFFSTNCFTIIRIILLTKSHYFPTQHLPTEISNGNHSVLYEVGTLGVLLPRRTNTRLKVTNCLMRILHRSHIFRMIKPRNMGWVTRVEPTGKLKYVHLGRKTLSELDLLFFDQNFLLTPRDFPVHRQVKTGSGAYPASYSVGTGSSTAVA